MTYKYEIKKLSDLPDHCIEHLAQLEKTLRQTIAPILEGQRKDMVICASIGMVANLIGEILYDDLEWLKENRDLYTTCFDVYLDRYIKINLDEKGLMPQPSKENNHEN